MKTDLVVEGIMIHNDKVLLIHHRKLDIWVPVGGHIDANETPDDALLREIKEETGLDIEILNELNLPLEGKTKNNLATPFYVNVHSVGDHDHCCFFYLCKVLNPESLKINKEVIDYRWFSREELEEGIIPLDVKNIALKALSLFNQHSSP
jgi:8-oxo-dGTP pyrophosphatase MutT (NUDIX family)